MYISLLSQVKKMLVFFINRVFLKDILIIKYCGSTLILTISLDFKVASYQKSIVMK